MAFFVRCVEPPDLRRRLACVLLLLLLPTARLAAQRLPVKLYTTADGLARNRIQRIVSDSKGFIWASTSEGLSRFDGHRFVNYGTRHGLASRIVNDLLEARDGTYWVATADGLCRLHPKTPQHLFTLYHRPSAEFRHSVNALAQDRSGAIWAGTDDGLFRETNPGAPDGGQPEHIDLGPRTAGDMAEIRAVIEDRQGSLWIGGAAGLFRSFPNGRVEAYSTADGLPTTFVETLLEDSQGRIWAGTRAGLCLIVADPQPGRKIVERVYNEADGLAYHDIKALSLAPDGTIWAGCLIGGVSEIRIGADGRARIRTYGMAQGLSDETITALAHDREGNLWAGSESSGLMRIVRSGLVTYTHADGLGSDRPELVFEDRAGHVCATGNDVGARHAYISWFDGDKFRSVSPPDPFAWPWVPVMQDRASRWWLGTLPNPVRLGGAPVERLGDARPEQVFAFPGELAGKGAYRLFEDSRGGVWISVSGPSNGLARWDPLSGLRIFGRTNGPTEQLVSTFAEDRNGDIWLGLNVSGIVRYRNGGFTQFSARDGVPAGYISSLHVDEAGRLWVGSLDGGLGRIDQPAAERPAIRIYDAAHGLSSDSVFSITSDRWGRIYAGTGRGLDRLDPASGRIQHYTTADGLANDAPRTSLRDHRGWLWFGTTKGLSRLIPEADESRPPPPIRITGLTVAGAPYAISQLGETGLSGLEFSSGDVQIEFASINFEAGEVMRYQYSIEGAGGHWSVPGDQRSVNLAGISPGTYLFQVRSVDSRGQVSIQPAAIGFRIPPPLWARLWFRVAALSLGCLLLYSFYRFRLDGMVELEHIRTRIATDLHDDIGSSLSQIAILSEVARGPDDTVSDAFSPLGRIADISRELVDSMADIVWSVNPRRDNLLDLTRRMRQFAGEVLVSHGIDFTFDAQGAAGDVTLGVDLRRQVFLIFKECVSNAARHSGAARVNIVFALSGGRLQLTIRDDGRGFDADRRSAGHGLTSMAGRAAALGGALEIVSGAGTGTNAKLDVPLVRRGVSSWWRA